MRLPPDLGMFSLATNGDAAPSAASGTGALTDEIVVERVRTGETALFEIIMRRYNQRLYRLARALLGDANEAEDVVQETYVRAFEHLAQFQGRARFSTWLTRIATYETRARIRRRRRRGALPDITMAALPDPSREGQPPAQRACAAELRHALTETIERLPRQLRAVLVLRDMEGLDTQETADCLGLTPTNVKVRLHRAREQLRRALEQRLGAEVKSLYVFDGARCDRIVHRVFEQISKPASPWEPGRDPWHRLPRA